MAVLINIIMIISRYLSKEISVTVLAVALVLLFIFISGEFIEYLAKAAVGELFASTVFKLLIIQIPIFLGLLLPLALYLAILLAYGRLFVDQEMTVLSACGMSPKEFIQIALRPIVVIMVLVGGVTLYLAPILLVQQDQLIREDAAVAYLFAVKPGQFQSLGDDRVLYVEERALDEGAFERVFIAERGDHVRTPSGRFRSWDALVAAEVTQRLDDQTQDRFIIFRDGERYSGVPGEKDYEITQFEEYHVRLNASPATSSRRARDTLPTLELLQSSDPGDRAELQWRIAIPLAALLLGLLAVPLSRVKPRQGRFAKLLPAILIFIVYFNLLTVGRRWLEQGVIPAWLGLWWVHLLILALILFLWQREGILGKQHSKSSARKSGEGA